jgi:hypothetical protein
MAHATIADVFNGFSRAASQGLDMYSRERQYHQNTKLYEDGQAYEQLQNKLAQDLYAVDDNGEMPFLNNPAKYRKYVESALADWRKKTGEEASKAGYGSRYYIDNLDRMFLQGQTTMENKIYTAEKQAARQQARIDVQKNIQREYNKPYSEDALSRALAFKNDAANNNVFDPEAAMERETEIVNTFWSKAGSYADNGTDTTTQAENAVQAKLDGYETSLRETHGINPDEYIENRQRKAGEMKQAAVMAVRERNYNNLDIFDNGYQQNLRDIKNRIPGWENLVEPTIEMFIKGRMEVNAGTEGNRRSEYADGKKPAMKLMFPWDDVLGDEPGGDPGAAVDSFVKGLFQTQINDVLAGNAIDETTGLPHTLNTLFQGEANVESLWKMIEGLAPTNMTAKKTLQYLLKEGGGDENNAKAAFRLKYFQNVLQHTQEYLRNAAENSHPHANFGIIDRLEDYLKTQKGLKANEADILAPVVQDLFYEMRFGPENQKNLDALVNRTITLLHAGKLNSFNPQATREDSIIRAVQSMQDNTEIISTLGEGRNNIAYLPGEYRDQVERLGTHLNQYLQYKLDTSLADTKGFRQEDDKVNEIIGVKVYSTPEGVKVTADVRDGVLRYGINRGDGWEWTSDVNKAREIMGNGSAFENTPGKMKLIQAELNNERNTFVPGPKVPGEWMAEGSENVLRNIREMARRPEPPDNWSGDWPDNPDEREILLLEFYDYQGRK